MIDDSVPWKSDLAKDTHALSSFLERYQQGKREAPSAALYYKVERFCFVSAFAIRRLIESQKLSDEMESTSISARVYQKRKRGYRELDIMTKGDIHKRYVLSRASRRRIKISTLCNMLIHTADFVVAIYPSRSLRIFFNSAPSARALVEVKIEDVLRLVADAANDDIVSAQWIRDASTGALKNVRKSRIFSEIVSTAPRINN